MTRIFKPDSGQDLKLQNNGGNGSVTITDASDLTIDSPADIILDAEGADVTLKDGGTTYGSLKQVSGHLVIQPTSSKEIILNDEGGSAALTVETDGDVTVDAGNLVMGTADKGIDFSGAQTAVGGTANEVLSGYEEGSWSGVVSDGTHPMAMDAATSTGYYTKVGNLVTISGYIVTTSLDGGSGNADGAIRITGLPFTIYNDSPAFFSGCAGRGSNLLITPGYSMGFFGRIDETAINLTVWDAEDGTSSMLASEWTADGQIMLGFTYRAA